MLRLVLLGRGFLHQLTAVVWREAAFEGVGREERVRWQNTVHRGAFVLVLLVRASEGRVSRVRKGDGRCCDKKAKRAMARGWK